MVSSINPVRGAGSIFSKNMLTPSGLLARGRTLLSRIEHFLADKSDRSLRLANAFEALEARQMLAVGPVLGDLIIVDSNNSTVSASDVAMNDDGSFVAVWQEHNGTDFDIYARRYDSDQTPIGGSFLVGSTFSSQTNPAVAVAGDKGFVVVWNSDLGAIVQDIFAQRYDSTGKVIGSTFRVNNFTTGEQVNPDVAMKSDGSFVVVWEDAAGADGSGVGIFVKGYNSSGSSLTGDVLVNQYTTAAQTAPSISMADNGTFVVSFSSLVYGKTATIAARRFQASVAANGSEFTVSANNVVGTESSSTDMAGDGSFGVTWKTDQNVFARLYNSTGTALAVGFKVNTDAGAPQRPRIGMDDDGGTVIAWGDTTSSQITTQAFSNAGVASGSNQALISSNNGAPALSMNSDGEYVVVAAHSAAGPNGVIQARAYAVAPNQAPVYTGPTSINLTVEGGATTANLDFASLFTDDYTGTGLLTFTTYAPVYEIYTAVSNANDLFAYSSSATGINIGLNDQSLNGRVTVKFSAEDEAGMITYASVQVDARAYAGIYMHSPQQVVNSTTDVSQDEEVSSVPLLGGGYILVWSKTNADSTRSIMGRVYDSAGTASGSEIVLMQGPAGSLWKPDAAALSNGGFVVTWDNSSSGGDIQAQRFDSTGSTVGAVITVNSFDGTAQYNSTVTGLAGGRFVVAWEGDGELDSNGVYARVFESDGTAVEAEFILDPGSIADYQYGVTLTSLNTGGFVAAWQRDNGAGTQSICTQVYDQNGAFTNAAVDQTIAYGANAQYPSVVGTTDGGYILAYSGSGPGTNPQGVYLLRFSSGNALIATTEVTDSAPGARERIKLASLNLSRVVVTWQGNGYGDDSAILARVYDQNLGVITQEFRANSFGTDTQFNPTAVAYGAQGGFSLIWSGQTSEASLNTNISQQVFSTRIKPGISSSFNPQAVITVQADKGFVLDLSTVFVNDWIGSGFGDLSVDTYVAAAATDAFGQSIITGYTFDGLSLAMSFSTSTTGDIVIDFSVQSASGPLVLQTSITVHVESTESLIPGEVLEVGSAPDTIYASASVKLSDDRSVLVWSVPGFGVYGRFMGLDGTFSGSEFKLSDNADLLYPDLSLTPTDDGGFLLTSITLLSSVHSVVAQRFDSAGALTKDYGAIAAADTDIQVYSPIIQTLSTGGFVTAWTQWDQAQKHYSLKAKIFDANGVVVTSLFDVIDSKEAQGGNASITELANGNFVVSWVGIVDENPDHIGAQIFSSVGVPIGTNFTVSQQNFSELGTPEVVALSTGGFAVTWQAKQDLTAFDTNNVYARAYYADGSPVSSEFVVNQTTSGEEVLPSIAALSDGNFVIAWNNESKDVSASIFNSYGVRIQSEFVVVQSTLGIGGYRSKLSALGAQKFFVSWNEDTTTIQGEVYEFVAVPVVGPYVIGDVTPRTIHSDQSTYSLDLHKLFADDAYSTDALHFSVVITSSWGEETYDDVTLTDGVLVLDLINQSNGDLNISVTATDPDTLSATADITVRVRGTQGIIPGDVPTVIGSVPGYRNNSALLSDGRSIVVWSASGVGLYGSFIDASGNAVGSPMLLQSNTEPSIPLPYTVSVTANQTGGFVLGWETLGSTGNSDLAVQVFDSTGVPQSAILYPDPFSTINLNAYAPEVQTLSNGDFVVTWVGEVVAFHEGNPYTVAVLYGKNYDAAGNATSSIYEITSGRSSYESSSITALSNGTFLVAWDDWYGTGEGVSGRLYYNKGNAVGDSFSMSALDFGSVNLPQTTPLSTGGFAVTWYGQAQGSSHTDIFVSIFSADGTALHQNIVVNAPTSTNQSNAKIASLADGNFVVSWYSAEGYLAVQVMNQDGVSLDGSHIVSGLTPWTNTLSSFGSTGFLVIWNSVDLEGRTYDFAPIPNDHPVASPIPTVLLSEDGYSSGFDLTSYFTDDQESSADLTYSIISVVNGGVIDYSLTGSLLEIAPVDGEIGVATMTVRATDRLGAFTDAQVYIAISASPDRVFYPLGPASIANVTQNFQMYPDVASAADGSYVMVWEAVGGPAGEGQIVGRRYSASGTALGAEFNINTLGGASMKPSVAMAWDGSFIVTWTMDGDIYARRFDNTGSALGSQFVVNADVVGDQGNASISAANDGRFVVAWEDSVSGFSIGKAQLFNSDGTVNGKTITLSDGIIDTKQIDIAVSMDSDTGSFWAVWSGESADDMGDIYARYYTDSGKFGSQFQVNTTTEGCQCDPAISVNSSGQLAIVWTGSYTDGEQIFAQLYQNGSAIGSEFIPSIEGSPYSDYADVGIAADGSFTVSWIDRGDDYNTYTVFVRNYDAIGTAAAPLLVSQDPERVYVFSTRIAVAPDGRFVVAWYDQDETVAISSRVYVPDYQLTAFPVNDVKIALGTSEHSYDLWDAFVYQMGNNLLTFTVENNTNPSLFGTDIASDGYLNLFMTPDQLGSGTFTIRATTPMGIYKEVAFTAEVAPLIATITLNDTDAGKIISGNLYDSGLFGDFSVTFIGLNGVKGGSILADFSFDLLAIDSKSPDSHGDFSITITGTPGKAAITFTGINECGCPINGVLYVNVLDTVSPEFEGFKAIPTVASATVGSVDIFFSEAIDTSSFNWESMILSRDGSANLIDASTGAGLTLTLVNAASHRYRVGGLAALTSHIGDYVLTLVDGAVKDLGGNVMGQGGDIDWRMRAAVPSAPTLSSYSEGVPGSGYTSSSTPTLVGTGTPGSTIHIYEGACLVGIGSVADNGTYSVVVDGLSVIDGDHTLKAQAFDGLGGATGYSANYTIHVFTFTPEITSITTFSGAQVEPVKQVQVRLNIAAAPGSFTWEKLLLTRNGGDNLTTSAITVIQSGSDPLLYTITIPYTITAEAGDYQLAVDGPNIQAMTLAAYTGGYTAWTMKPVIIGMSGYTVPLVNPLAYMAIRFGTQIDPGTFDWNDVMLTRDGGGNIATSGITITQSSADPLVYLINLPASLVSAKGAYVLKVNGAGIHTPGAAPFANNAQGAWSMNAAIIGMSGYTVPLSVPLAIMSVRFGTQINTSTFDYNDLQLTRNGGSNIATSAMTITQSATDPLIYNISLPLNLVSPEGSYVLKVLGANIQTQTGGGTFSNNAQGAWSMLPAIVSIPTYPTTQFVSPVNTLAVRFGTAINPATFNWGDITLTRNGGGNLATSAIVIAATADPLVYNISLPNALVSEAGVYLLKVTAGGILTPGGTSLVHDVQSTWTMRPAIIGMSGYTVPLNNPLAYMAVRFGTQINQGTFDFNDLQITRNGGPNLTSSAVTITQSGTDPLVYLINLPASMVSEAGSYVVKVLGAGIQTLVGATPLANNAQGAWTMNTVIIGMSGYNPSTLSNAAVRFGTQVKAGTFDWSNLELTRNGGGNLADNTITITQSGTDPLVYMINIPTGLMATPGAYTLKVLGADIESIYNINFVNNTQAIWTILPI